ncbi:hypothetical protein M501DRAFT_1026984 [Patellaria atrata CBS 101060]|uniref:Altered inheritance of mitochondria protein 24, mitochondrial n=1 Tax=Patellaria atrata CBS 101060 TaxID=1346257 RepID=A0A9P4VP32_9PEZI|nr:hypothetical protein M501DRAFT_1026984 [Patellaria atrata CBS 101060]
MSQISRSSLRSFRNVVRSQRSKGSSIERRLLQIHATPSASSPTIDQESGNGTSTSIPDARFEVLGSPYSLLSVSLSASQNLYTRKGSLVGLSGKAENTISTLSILEPFRRSLLGIPFLYQKISSTSPISALISTKSPISSFAVVHLDGRLDWIVAQRQALLAWTGHTLKVSPKLNTQLSLAHWGNSHVSGRGLVGLAGKGQIYQIALKAGEQYVAHPGNVIAYTLNQRPPLPYRFKSTSFRLQLPSVSTWLPDTKFFRELRHTQTWKNLSQFLFTLRTWARRTIWGDRLFLQFTGPNTILLQSRGSRLRDVLTTRDVNEIADSPAGAVQSAVTLDLRKESGHGSTSTSTPPSASTRAVYATVGSGGKVRFGNS